MLLGPFADLTRLRTCARSNTRRRRLHDYLPDATRHCGTARAGTGAASNASKSSRSRLQLKACSCRAAIGAANSLRKWHAPLCGVPNKWYDSPSALNIEPVNRTSARPPCARFCTPERLALSHSKVYQRVFGRTCMSASRCLAHEVLRLLHVVMCLREGATAQ